MRAIVKMDEKGRVHVPNKMRRMMKIRPRQLVSVEIKGGELVFKKVVKPNESDDEVLKDMFERPVHAKVKITKELLDKITDELWSS